MTAPRPRKPWAVVVVKPSSGTTVIFSMFETQSEADLACSRLNSFGLTSRVERVQEPDTAPGSTLYLPRRDSELEQESTR